MHCFRIARSLLVLTVAWIVLAGGQGSMAQSLRVEVGGGWAIPSSNVDLAQGGAQGTTTSDPGWGPNGYGALGLEWTLSSNFALAGFLRVQQSWMRGDSRDLTAPFQPCQGGGCSVSNDPDGRLRAATFEGRITLTSTGRIQPYFLVGLGIVRSTVEGAVVEDESGDLVVRFEEAQVTDAGGDVGFGAFLQVVRDLSLAAEIRATGSLPGAKENAVTTFPFTLGLSYKF